MMQTIYFKQAWQLLKQNKLFSGLYIVGTGLAIAMVMVVAVVYYVKIAPIYPETERMRTYYLEQVRVKNDAPDSKGMLQWSASYTALQEWFYPLKNVEVVSAVFEGRDESAFVQPADLSGDFPVAVKYTDPAFFRIYSFRFLEGKSFAQADLESGIRNAVITDELARRLFGTVRGVVGRSFSLNHVDCRVCGVVKSASSLTSRSYANIYLPYSVEPTYKEPVSYDPIHAYVGCYQLIFLVRDDEQAEALRNEVADLQRNVNVQNKGKWQVEFWQQPVSNTAYAFQQNMQSDFDTWGIVKTLLLVMAALLLVPSLNLSGLISSRMENRLPEMGVRKSFGAGRGRLLSQVMWENLVLTLLGGLLGLLLAWLLLYVLRDWVFTMFDAYPETFSTFGAVRVPGEVLFAPAVFVGTLLFCLVINLLSAFLPAWHSLRRPIVASLFEKR